MPNTRKKVIKTMYKDEEDSEIEEAYSDSGSEAKISEESTSEDEAEGQDASSGDDFKNTKKSVTNNKSRRPKFAKSLISKITKQNFADDDHLDTPTLPLFSVKDLTEEDKLLPSLNLSESDSSDDESQKPVPKKASVAATILSRKQSLDSENAEVTEYKDVWTTNEKEESSEEIARKAFLELERHKSLMEETKASIDKYTHRETTGSEFNVNDLLAQGEEIIHEKPNPTKKISKLKKVKDDSESETEDWEEVKESNAIPQQGLQLFVEFPNAARKSKKVDVEMMMKRKINRVKKEYQVYMHKVHVLCWLGHGNYVSKILNDQEVLSASLTLVPSKECYPGERVDMKYLEQITTWYKDKFTLRQDKNENKYKPKAPPLKEILISQIKSRVVTTKKYLVYIFICMLRALGVQCRVMYNFVTLPLKPPSSELCSLSTKPKEEKKTPEPKCKQDTNNANRKILSKKKEDSKKKQSKEKISQVDGANDSVQCYKFSERIPQLDGNDDLLSVQVRSTRSRKQKSNSVTPVADIIPIKKSRKSPSPKSSKSKDKTEQESKNMDSKNNEVTNSDKNYTNKKTITSSPVKTAEDDQMQNDVATKRIRNSPSPRSSKRVAKSKLENQTFDTKSKTVAKSKLENQNVDTRSKTVAKSKLENQNSNTKKSNELTHSIKTISKVKESSPSRTKLRNETVRDDKNNSVTKDAVSPPTTRNNANIIENTKSSKSQCETKQRRRQTEEKKLNPPKIVISNDSDDLSSKYFDIEKDLGENKIRVTRKRSKTTTPSEPQGKDAKNESLKQPVKSRTKSAPGISVEKSKYFDKDTEHAPSQNKKPKLSLNKSIKDEEDKKRVSHRDLVKSKVNNDVKDDLVAIIKGRIKEEKKNSKKEIVKGKAKDSDEDSDYLPEESAKRRKSADSDEDFKPAKVTPKAPKPGTSKKIDRRVLSTSDEELPKNKVDVWCEVFVEELEQWISVDVVKAKVHCAESLYSNATHPVCYVVGWDNNNYLKDLTRRYVPHWNTVTRKQRAEPEWWNVAIQPWLGPKNARDREEDEQLDRMQLEAPLPKSIAEYKNHPLYALKRHLLKFEALYPPDAAVLGFVRNEPVYARECVYVCHSRDVWLKEAKVVRLGEKPYKIVKARPKWDKLSNTLITDKPLEIFGPWQVQDYEPPVAEDGIIPRNAYGNVELFKDCMLPKGTVHIKLPGLNKVAKKLNIDCAPAMVGFDFNGGWSHPVYDGFVVCKEFEEIITEAWVKDQEDQERREREKIDARVYGNWRRLIKGLLIRERLKLKYGFEEPSTSEDKKKQKGPRLVVKKK